MMFKKITSLLHCLFKIFPCLNFLLSIVTLYIEYLYRVSIELSTGYIELTFQNLRSY